MTDEEYSKACEFLHSLSYAIRVYKELLRARGESMQKIFQATDPLWEQWNEVKKQADAHREKIGVFAGLDELTRIGEEMGLYDD